MDTVRDKDKDKVQVEILIHSVIETTVKMGIDNLSGSGCSTETSIMPVIKVMGIRQDIEFNGTLKGNTNNMMNTPKPKTKIRTKITVDNEEAIG